MKAFGIAVAMLLMSVGAARGQVPPQQWVIIDLREDRVTAYDSSGIRELGNVRRGWYIIINRVTDEQGGDYSLNNFDLDCVEETFRLRTIALFKADGSSVETFRPESPGVAIIPGSGGALLSYALCDGGNVGDPIPRTVADFVADTRDYLNGEPP